MIAQQELDRLGDLRRAVDQAKNEYDETASRWRGFVTRQQSYNDAQEAKQEGHYTLHRYGSPKPVSQATLDKWEKAKDAANDRREAALQQYLQSFGEIINLLNPAQRAVYELLISDVGGMRHNTHKALVLANRYPVPAPGIAEAGALLEQARILLTQPTKAPPYEDALQMWGTTVYTWRNRNT